MLRLVRRARGKRACLRSLALARFLDLLDEVVPSEGPPELDPLALSFQLKLLWLSGYLPHVTACVECGEAGDLIGFSARAGGAVCRLHARASFPLSPGGLTGIEQLLSIPLAEAAGAGLGERARREALAVVTSSYEEHGGFRLRLQEPVRMKRELGEGYELDDDPARIDVGAVHTFISEESYWAPGRDYHTQERLVREAARVVGLYHVRAAGRILPRSLDVRLRAGRVPGRRLCPDRTPRPRSRGRARPRRDGRTRPVVANRPWLLHKGDAHDLYRKFLGSESQASGSWSDSRPSPRRRDPACRELRRECPGAAGHVRARERSGQEATGPADRRYASANAGPGLSERRRVAASDAAGVENVCGCAVGRPVCVCGCGRWRRRHAYPMSPSNGRGVLATSP